MELSKYVACICEGTAEAVIVDKLLEAERLIFTREDLLENELIRTRGAANFEQRYLRKSYQDIYIQYTTHRNDIKKAA